MLKTHETVYDTDINSNILLKLQKKNATTNENFILRKMSLNFKTLASK